MAILDRMFPDWRADTPSPLSDVWPDIEAALDDLTDLSRTVTSPRSFCAQLASSLASATTGKKAAVWLLPGMDQGRQGWQCLARYPEGELSGEPSDWLQAAAQAAAVSFHSPSKAAPEFAASVPVQVDETPLAVLQITCGEADNPTLRRALARILEAFAEVAADYFAHHQRRRLLAAQETWSKTERFVELAHQQWDWKPTAYTLANESRTLQGCDRLSVLRRRGKHYQIEAVSGLELVDRRANQVRDLEQLANQAARFQQPICYGLPGEPEELQAVFEPYVDASHAKVVTVLPLVNEKSLPEVLLIGEFFETPEDETGLRDRMQLISRHAEIAAQQALRLNQMPLRLPSKLLESMGWRWTWSRTIRWTLGLVAIAVVLAAAALVQTDLEVKARGELQPAVQRRVFAPADGSIERLFADHGDYVEKDQPLLVMSDRQLAFDEARLRGELQTTIAELKTVRTSRLKVSQNASDIEADNELAAQETQLEQRRVNLNDQLEILGRKRLALDVRSPLAGQIISGDIRHDLSERPVKRGQRLLIVAATEGEWILKLRVPDERMKHVLQAQRARAQKEQAPPLRVRFMLASQPGRMYEGRVREISGHAESQAGSQPHVVVTVNIDHEQIDELHAGADVAARIVCQRTSIGYAWLHGLYERFRIQFFV